MTRALLFGLLVLAALGVVLLSSLWSGEEPVDPIGRHEAPVTVPTDAPATEVEGPAARIADPAAVSDPPSARRLVEVEAAPTEEDLGPQRLDLGDEHLDVVVVLDDGSAATRVSFLLALSPLDGEAQVGAELKLRSDDGRYRLEGLTAGQWRVFASRPPELFGDVEEMRITYPVPHPGPPPVLTLHEAGGLAGTVLDAEGDPIEARLSLGGTPGGDGLKTRSSEDDGSFRYEGLRPCTLPLRAETEFGLSTEVMVEVEPGRVTDGVVLRLPAGGWIEVTVLDREGDPQVEAEVVVLSTEEVVEGESADENGQARFGPLPAGSWQVVSVLDQDGRGGILSGQVDVLAEETSRVELRPPTDAITVSGVVTLGGEPLHSEAIYFFREGSPLVEGVSMAATDENGRYEMQIAGPGPVQVMVEDNEPVPIARVVIPDEPTFRLDLRVPAGSVSGRVIGPDGGDRRWRVLLEREDGFLELLFPDNRPGETTSPNGRFHFEQLRPGSYRLRLMTDDSNYAPALTGIEVGIDEEIEELELHVQPGGALLVEVRRPDGTPVPDASVLARDAGGLPLIDLPRVSAGGRAHLRGLQPGRVLISAQAGDAVAVRAARVDLEREVRVELVLEPGARLEVRCEREGAPLGASIRLFGPDGDEVTRMLALSDYRPGFTAVLSSSTARFGPLPPGRYEVRVSAPDGTSSRKTVRLSAGDAREEVVEL